MHKIVDAETVWQIKVQGEALMDINKTAMENPMQRASAEFIEQAIRDVEDCIVQIEQTYKKVLIGDRSFLDQARQDWKRMTNIQVAYAASLWRAGIWQRYHL